MIRKIWCLFKTAVVGKRGSKDETILTMSLLLKLNDEYIRVKYTLLSILG